MDFLHKFSKNIKIRNFVKILTVGAELFHADGRTDRQTDRQKSRPEEGDSRFSQFGENP